jgi:recombinational DNA repair protein RecR
MNALGQAKVVPKNLMHACKVCGSASESTICEQCSARIRIEALARKHHEEKGTAWSQWE